MEGEISPCSCHCFVGTRVLSSMEISSRPMLIYYRPSESITWLKPDCGSLKCNVDAAVFAHQNSMGFCCIVHDNSDALMAASNGIVQVSSLLIATPMGVVKKWGVKCHFVTLNSVLTPLNSIFAPMICVKMGYHFNNSMFFY